MSSYDLLLHCALALLVASAAVAEQIKFDYCDSQGQSECEISNVNIIPCPEAATGEPCKLKKGTNATLTYDFNPKWAPGAGTIKTRAFWAHILDLPFVGMDTDVCQYTTCPITKDQQNAYKFNLQLSKQYLSQKYNIKFKIWEEDAEPRKECCLIFKLRLF